MSASLGVQTNARETRSSERGTRAQADGACRAAVDILHHLAHHPRLGACFKEVEWLVRRIQPQRSKRGDSPPAASNPLSHLSSEQMIACSGVASLLFRHWDVDDLWPTAFPRIKQLLGERTAAASTKGPGGATGSASVEARVSLLECRAFGSVSCGDFSQRAQALEGAIFPGVATSGTPSERCDALEAELGSVC